MAERTFLTDANHVRSIAINLSSTIVTDAKIAPHLAKASRDLKRWVGASNYAASLALITTARTGLGEGETLETHGELLVQEESLRIAEAYACLASMIPGLNWIQGDGGIQVSVVTDRGQTNALRPDQVKRMVNEYKREAQLASKAYWASGTISSGKSEAVWTS
jgi:hypothetical protein